MSRIMDKIGSRGLMLAAFLAVAGLAPSTASARVVVRRSVNYRPVARAAVATAAVVGTAVVIGSVVRSLPPRAAR